MSICPNNELDGPIAARRRACRTTSQLNVSRCAALALAMLLFANHAAHSLAAETEKSPVKLSTQTGPLRIGVVGLVHDHAHGLLSAAAERDDLEIVGVYEPNRELFDRYASRYHLDPSLYHASLGEMLEATRPEVASVMTSIKEHRVAVAECAPRGVHLFLEKPLAFSSEDARAIEELGRRHGVLVLTNFETSWYASIREAKRLVDAGEAGPIRKMIFRHGHKGPREIGCSREFLDWLTDPEQNGGGAIVDFGCYGAAISTWLMNGERPTSVAASATTLKPSVYPHVDDDATIVLTYPGATAVIEASWAWTHDTKETDIYAEGRSADSGKSFHAGKWDQLQVREENRPLESVEPPPFDDQWTYLRKVVRGQCEVDPLSSIELNLVVADILDQARRSAARGGAADEGQEPSRPRPGRAN